MKEKLLKIVKNALSELGLLEVDFNVEFPADMNYGDYSTNVAIVLHSFLGRSIKENKPHSSINLFKTDENFSKSSVSAKYNFSPRRIAEEIKKKIEGKKPDEIDRLDIAGVGFINFHLSKKFFKDELKEIISNQDFGKGSGLLGKKILIEYTQPNPFKPFHIGHLMSNTIGESISRILEWQGASVVRVNYQGDIGLHVAKSLYGIKVRGGVIKGNTPSEKAQFIGECYADGNSLYESEENIKKEIDKINTALYSDNFEFSDLYKEGREITLEAFEEIYKTLGTKFDKYYFESEMTDHGKGLVVEYEKKGVFEISDGAYIFRGEKYDPKLHTRVFITSSGLPLYEAKEIALTVKKFKDYNPDLSITTTAVEQKDYMHVVTEAIKQMFQSENYVARMKHVNHGMMRFESGKMSSRLGNVITGESLLKDSKAEILKKIQNRDLSVLEKEEIATLVGVSAIKYSILKTNIGADILFDFEKSISFTGDSGPYLQYSAVRANSVLNRVGEIEEVDISNYDPTAKEMSLIRLMHHFPEVTLKSYQNLAPHIIVSYLIQLAGKFNHFYADNIFIDPNHLERSSFRINIAKAFSAIMQNGLNLLGIKIPDKM